MQFLTMDIKFSENNHKKTHEIAGFSKEKLLEMNTLCRAASRFKNMKYDADIQSEVNNIKRKSNKQRELFNGIENDSYNQIIPIYDEHKKCVGCVFIKNKEVTIAYRGTKNWHDFELDVNLFKDRSSQKIGALLLKPTGKVHEGFFEGYVESLSSTLNILSAKGIFESDAEFNKSEFKIKPNNDWRINIIGHSLGGTKAVQMAESLTKMGFKNVYVATFGSPKCFNDKASDSYDKILGDRTLQVNNSNDIIPQLPPEGLNYYNLGQTLVISSKSIIPCKEHKLSVYREGIIELKEEDFIGVKYDRGNLSKREAYYANFVDPRATETFKKKRGEINKQKDNSSDFENKVSNDKPSSSFENVNKISQLNNGLLKK